MAVLINRNPHRKSTRAVSPNELNPMIPKAKRKPNGNEVVDLATFKKLITG